MTGRHGGRGRGRGGRGGRGGTGRGSSRPQTPKKKKTIEDYYFYVGSSKQATDYEITAEFVVTHIKKTFDRGNDIAESLRTLVKQDADAWLPTLRISTSTNDETKTRENKQSGRTG